MRIFQFFSFNVHHVFIEIEPVTKEYLERCKMGPWKKENMEDSLKYWNFERILEAEVHGLPMPHEMKLDELNKEIEVMAEGWKKNKEVKINVWVNKYSWIGYELYIGTMS